MAFTGDILHRLVWMKFIRMLSMYVQFGTQAFPLKNYCGFNTKSYSSDVCGYHWCSQTLAKICRNMGICCSSRGVATSEKYPGFILLTMNHHQFKTWSNGLPHVQGIPISQMHLSHIPQYTILNRNMHISAKNGALWDMRQVHDGICEIGLL